MWQVRLDGLFHQMRQVRLDGPPSPSNPLLPRRGRGPGPYVGALDIYSSVQGPGPEVPLMAL